MKSRKDELIEKISAASGSGDLLLDFMELYELDGLMDATEEQLAQYVTDNGLR